MLLRFKKQIATNAQSRRCSIPLFCLKWKNTTAICLVHPRSHQGVKQREDYQVFSLYLF